MARRPDLPFSPLGARGGRDLADLDDAMRREFNVSAGGVFSLKEIAYRIGLDRLRELSDQQLEAEMEVSGKRMVGGQITALVIPTTFDGAEARTPLVERDRTDGSLELTDEAMRFLRRIAEEYEVAPGF